jgi:tetratricopeptide (TPR) repeat protein
MSRSRLRDISLVWILAVSLRCARGGREIPLTSAAQRSPEVVSILSESSAAYQRGNLFLTQQLLLKALALAPDDPDIALDLGDTLNRLQHRDAARELYARFLTRHPSATQVRLAMGLTLMTLGRWEDAAEQIGRVARESPQDPNARFNFGLVLSRLGRYSEAVTELRQASELAKTDSDVFTEMGIALMREAKLEPAVESFQESLRLNPAQVASLFNLGQCYERLGRHEESRATLARFAAASGSQERFLDEKRLFKAAQAQEDSLARQGKDEPALAALLAYRDSLSDFPLFQQELGVAYLRAGHRSEAIAAFERAVGLDSNLTEAQSQLAALYQQDGESGKAMKARQSAARPRYQGPQPAEKP